MCNNRRINNVLNFLKGVGCIAVVLIHVRFPGLFGELIHKLSQFAVPIFFMISGYFSYSEDGIGSRRVWKKARRIFRITMVATVFYLVYSMWAHYIVGDFALWINSVIDPKIMLKFIVLNDFDFIGASHLWFLPSLAYSYVILCFVERYSCRKLAYRVLPFLFVLKIVVSASALSFDLSWHLYGNFFIGGLP